MGFGKTEGRGFGVYSESNALSTQEMSVVLKDWDLTCFIKGGKHINGMQSNPFFSVG